MIITRDMIFCVVDTETTGFSSTHNEIVEVGAILFDGTGKILGEYQELFRPQVLMGDKVMKIHGITNEMVKDCRSYANGGQAAFMDFSGPADILIGHNIKTFDIKFLRIDLPDNKMYDTLNESRTQYPRLKKHTLMRMVKHFNIPIVEGFHRAMADAHYNKDVFMHLAFDNYQDQPTLFDSDQDKDIKKQEEATKAIVDSDAITVSKEKVVPAALVADTTSDLIVCEDGNPIKLDKGKISLEVMPESKIPFLWKDTLIVPSDAPEKYRWWRSRSANDVRVLSVLEILKELNASEDIISKYYEEVDDSITPNIARPDKPKEDPLKKDCLPKPAITKQEALDLALSYSSSNTLDQCAFKFYCEKIAKIKVDKPEPIYFTVGKAVHFAAELGANHCLKSVFTEQFKSCIKSMPKPRPEFKAMVVTRLGEFNLDNAASFIYDNPESSLFPMSDALKVIDKECAAEYDEMISMIDPRSSTGDDIKAEVRKEYPMKDEEDAAKDADNLIDTVLSTAVFFRPSGSITFTERKFAFNSRWEQCEWEDPDAIWRAIVDYGIIDNDEGHIYIRDYKTNRKKDSVKELEVNMQLKAYVYVMWLLFGEKLKRVTLEWYFVRFGRNGIIPIQYDNIAEIVTEVKSWIQGTREVLRNRVEKKKFEPNINDNCTYCDFQEKHCPLFKNAIKKVSSEFDSLSSSIKCEMDTAEQAKNAALFVSVVGSKIEVIKAGLKKYVAKNGAIKIDYDFVYGMNMNDNNQFITKKAVSYLVKNGVSQDAIWSQLTLSPTKFNKLCTAHKVKCEDPIAAGIAINRPKGKSEFYSPSDKE